MNKIVIVTSLMVSMLAPVLSYSAGEPGPASSAPRHTLPVFEVKNRPPLGKWNPMRLCRFVWPSTPWVITTKQESYDPRDLVGAAQERITKTQEVVANLEFHKQIKVFSEAQANRLAIYSLGFWLLKGYHSLNPSISFTNGIRQLFNQTTCVQHIKTVGLIAGTFAALKYAAPYGLRKWHNMNLKCKAQAYQKKTGLAIESALITPFKAELSHRFPVNASDSQADQFKNQWAGNMINTMLPN